MDERLKFVARRLAGEAMSELCREFGISRKTGYKIFARYEQCCVRVGIMATVDYELPCGRMLDVNQIGHALGKAPKTIRNWIASGRLGSFKIGGHVRVSEDEVLELLARSHRWGK